ncbi:MAG: hypothetical protein ABI165_18350, partial [Bryobacteraceae bacterium]
MLRLSLTAGTNGDAADVLTSTFTGGKYCVSEAGISQGACTMTSVGATESSGASNPPIVTPTPPNVRGNGKDC